MELSVPYVGMDVNIAQNRRYDQMIQRLLKEFVNLSSTYRSKPWWAWNGKLNPEKLLCRYALCNEVNMMGRS